MAKRVIMVIPPEKFRDEEYLEPRDLFQERGIDVRTASKITGLAYGMLGATVDVNFNYNNISVENFDAIVFVGGSGASVYFDDPVAMKLAKDFYAAKKIVAAICIAPSILANAGILQGKNATAFSSESSNLRAKGAYYTGEDITQDGRIITAKGPSAAKQFAETIAQALGQ